MYPPLNNIAISHLPRFAAGKPVSAADFNRFADALERIYSRTRLPMRALSAPVGGTTAQLPFTTTAAWVAREKAYRITVAAGSLVAGDSYDDNSLPWAWRIPAATFTRTDAVAGSVWLQFLAVEEGGYIDPYTYLPWWLASADPAENKRTDVEDSPRVEIGNAQQIVATATALGMFHPVRELDFNAAPPEEESYDPALNFAPGVYFFTPAEKAARESLFAEQFADNQWMAEGYELSWICIADVQLNADRSVSVAQHLNSDFYFYAIV